MTNCACAPAVTSPVAELSRSSCEPTFCSTSACLRFDVALLQIDALLREVEHLSVDFDVGDQILISGPGLFELGLGLVERKLERFGIDLEQLIARLDVLAFLHHDLDDFAGDVGRDQHLLSADIGVVGGHVAAAIEIEHEPADRCRKRQHDQEQEAAVAPHSSHQPAARFRGKLPCRPAGRRALLFGWKFQYRISHSAAPSWAPRLHNSEWRYARFP